MRPSIRLNRPKAVAAGAACLIARGVAGPAAPRPVLAQSLSPQAAPRSYEVSPEIYRVLAARGQTRVLMITWAPGQSDRMHSHGPTAGYFLTDCSLRYRFPDGRVVEGQRKAGTAFVQDPIAAHEVQNIGDAECRIVMTETD